MKKESQLDIDIKNYITEVEKEIGRDLTNHEIVFFKAGFVSGCEFMNDRLIKDLTTKKERLWKRKMR